MSGACCAAAIDLLQFARPEADKNLNPIFDYNSQNIIEANNEAANEADG